MRSVLRTFLPYVLSVGSLACISCKSEPDAAACAPNERRCRCTSDQGMVHMCFAQDWTPVGCYCAGGDDRQDRPQRVDAGQPDSSAPESDGGPALPAPLEVTADPSDEAAYLFDDAQLRTYNIVIAQADLDRINAKPADEAWVPANLEFEGTVYGPYEVRYKGAAGSFQYPCTTGEFEAPKEGKCSMKLGFNEVDAEARFFGLKKLNLHAMNHDGSLLRDRLSYALFREYGLAAPRAVHVRVLINGKFEGLFVAVEQIDGRFTRARFSDGGEGNLYKEAWPVYSDPNEYVYSLETNEDEEPSVERMLEWQRMLQAGGDDFDAFVDPAYVARYMAVDRVIVNDDGMFHFYCDLAKPNEAAWNHNYYWYEGADQRFWLIPWDLDYAFDGSPWVRLHPSWSTETSSCECVDFEGIEQVPASCDPVVQELMNLQPEYEREIDGFLAGPFAAERIDAKLAAWTEQIRESVNEAAAGDYDVPNELTWADSLDELKATISATRQARGLSF
jgi:spore coat protein H